jgi:hypothetical protein
MKRYAIFAWDDDYIGGGMYDFLKSFHTHEEAVAYQDKMNQNYQNVYIEDMDEYE